MPRYQLHRPCPVKIVSRRVRRQDPAASIAPTPAAGAAEPEEAEEGREAEEEEEEGPESPDSLDSSPLTVGAASESEDSESEDEAEEPSPIRTAATATSLPLSTANGVPVAPLPPGSAALSTPVTRTVAPQASGTAPSIQSAAVTTVPGQAPKANIPVPSASLATGQSSAPAPPTAAESETAREEHAPQPIAQEEKTLITKGAVAAAITLSILGAVVLIVAVVIFLKRRKRRRDQHHRRVAEDALNPNNNSGSLHAPEVVHVATDLPFYGGAGSHFTRTTERSDTLFGPGPYERPETVSTERNRPRLPVRSNVEPPQPTPNPFADPPLNKAYDVLGGRPRSTTLTDRGSWVKNPFKNPESARFDPFGELQGRARQERRKQMEEARRKAELTRQNDFATQEQMGIAPPQAVQQRKGSDATFEGLGVLDRTGGGKY